MAQFQQIVTTLKGRALMAKMLTGMTGIDFKRIQTSSDEYTPGQLALLTEFESVNQSTLISSIARINETAIKIESAINNYELTRSYNCNTVGITAIDPDEGEILFGVTIVDLTVPDNTPDFIPAFNGVTSTGLLFDLILTVDSADSVNLEVDPAAVVTVKQYNELNDYTRQEIAKIIIIQNNHITNTDIHSKSLAMSEDGVHGLRYFDGAIEVWDGEKWNKAASGIGGGDDGGGGTITPPEGVINIAVTVSDNTVFIKWTDPDDRTQDGLSIWAGTKLVRKLESFPENVGDGELVVDSRIRNAYKNEPYADSGLTAGVTYYYQLFPYTFIGMVNGDPENRFTARSPTAEQVNMHEEALIKHGKDYVFHRYDGAGHAFWNYTREAYRPVQAMDSWNKAFEFFEKHLRT